MKWIVVTGGGSGIGRAMVQHFSKQHMVLTCGRRWQALEETKREATVPEHVTIVQADICNASQRMSLVKALPPRAEVRLLVQNAAIGDPAPFQEVDPDHLEAAFQVNVVAPMALCQLFLPALQRCQEPSGRILHLGTSVAHRPQEGTLTYGVTKMAFHRLYQQINAEQIDGGIVCGSMSPGMVDTEGVRDHVSKARACKLPHVKYFDQALFANTKKNQNHKTTTTTPMDKLMVFVEELLVMDAHTFASKEWRFNEWASSRERAVPPQEGTT